MTIALAALTTGVGLLAAVHSAVAAQVAHPDIAELDVFLGQHILLTLEQHFNPKI